MHELDALRAEAVRLAKAGEWGANAADLNTRILAADPDDVAALTRRGRCHYECGDLDAAKKDYERALRLDPTNRIAGNFLTKITGPKSVRDAQATQRERERVAAKSRRKSAEYEARRRRALAFALAEKQRKEAADYRRTERLTSFEEALDLGVAARESRDYQLAIEAFRQAFRLDTSRYDVIVRLAATHRANKEPGEARRLYEWVLEREESRVALVGLAAVYRDQKRPVEACALYRKALSKDPRDRHALVGLAGALSDLGLREQAARTFEKADASGGDSGREGIRTDRAQTGAATPNSRKSR